MFRTLGRGALVLAWMGVAGWATRGETAYFLVTNAYVDCNYTATRDAKFRQLWSDDYVPTNAADVVYVGLPDAPMFGSGRFYPMGSTAFAIDAIAWAPLGFSFYFSSNASGLTLRDASNCFASWLSNVGGVTFTKTTGTPGPLVFQRMQGAYRPVFNAPAAADAICISNLYCAGVIEKRGVGTLRLARPAGGGQVVNLHVGTLELGHDDAADDQPAPDRYFHLDAAATNTLLAYVRADGRTCVTNWLDADGKARKASPVTVSGAPDYATCPFLGDETAANGVRLVSFGGYSQDADDVAAHGPAARLWLSYQSGAREIFQVVKINGTRGWGFYLSTYYQDGFRLSSDADALHVGAGSFLMAPYNQRLNGVPFGLGARRDVNRLAVVSSFENYNANVSGGWFLCCNYADQTAYGGYSAAEVLVYDRVLTEAERQATIRYLARKWLADTERSVYDAGVVSVRGADAETRVAAGARADVRAVRVHDPAHAFVKSGAGELRVEETYPAAARLRVKEGRLVFTETKTPQADPQPAAGAALHVDATQPASFIEELDDQGEPTGSILGWKDWRAGRTLYYTNDAAVVEKARVAPASMNGLASVDFGTAISDTAPAFILRDASGAAVPKFATVFVVWESITGSADAVPHPLGGNGWSFLRSSKSNLAGTFYDVGAHAEIQGARWTVDGEPFNRDGEAYGQALGAPAVWGAAFPTCLNVTYLGRSQDAKAGGGLRVGEAIFYTRPLSDAERRDTEAYLLKKWKNAAHPAYRARVGALAFDAGVANELAVAGGTRTFASVEGSGTLVKTGPGTACVEATTNTSLAVRGGTLSVAYSNPFVTNVLASALYHFDAEAAASLTTQTNGARVSILRMAHASRADGYAADGTTSPYATAVTNAPALVETTIAGRARKVVDFGSFFTAKAVDGVYPVDNDAAAFTVTGTWSMREFYIVVRDTDPQKRKPLFDSWEYFIDRGANGAMFVANGSHDCFSSYALTLDGEDVTYSTVLPDGWHVVFLAPGPSAAPFWGGFGATVRAGQLLMGGQQVAEFLAFNTVHDAACRAAIVDRLRRKWLGEGTGQTLALDALEIASNTVLNVALDGYQALSAARAGGAGTLTLPAGASLRLDALDVEVGAGGTVACTTVDAPVTLAEGFAVRLRAASGTHLARGAYPLLKAEALSGGARCGLVDPQGCCRAGRCRRTADALWLDVVPCGSVVIFR